MQGEIDSVKSHLSTLGAELSTTQLELSGKQMVRRALEAEIRKKSEEAQTWEAMTEGQRAVFSDSAVAAMSKESRGTFWWRRRMVC